MRYELNKNKFLSELELKMLLETLDKYPCRDTLLIKLAVYTGARASELLGLTKDRMFDGTKSILILATKGSKNRELPLKPALYRALKEYADSIQGNLLFDISYQRLYQIWNHYRPCKKTFHALRHTFAVTLYQKTRDVKLVQLALGHKDMGNSQIYLDFCYSLNEMRKIL